MTDRQVKEKIRQSMDHSLSGLPCDAFLTARVLKRAKENKGDERMRTRRSGSLVLVVLLTVLLAIAALALNNWETLKGYFETVRVMDLSGELARWSDEDKIKLLEAMTDAGITTEQDARVKTALDASRPLSERGSAADAIITERYGESYFDSYTVEQLEFPETTRTQEEQVVYGQWSEEYWTQWDSQEKQPIIESRIYLAMMNILTEVGDFPRALLRDVQASSVWDEDKRIYTVTASIDQKTYLEAERGADQITLFDPQSVGFEDGDSFCFRFWIDEYGAFLGIEDPNGPEARAKLSLSEAQEIAEKALELRLGVDAAMLKEMTLRSSFSEGSEYILEEGRFQAIGFFQWEQKGEDRYLVEIDAQTGRVVKAFDWRESEAMKTKEGAWIAEIQGLLRAAGISDTLYNARGEYFWGWTVGEKAAWSQIARPIVQGYVTAHAEFAQYLEDVLANRYEKNYWPNLISLTQYAYGVKDAASISQAKAFEIAREIALERGAQQAYVDDSAGHVFYYDVTDPDRPLWKVLISTLFGAGDAEHPYDATAAWGYFVVIDAHTGETLRITQRTVNTRIQEIV